MVTEVDRLVEIQRKDLHILRDMHAGKSDSRTSIAFGTIDIYIQWIEKDPNQSKYIKFFCLNGDFSDGTFIVIERNRAFADTLSSSFGNLHRILQLIDYSNGYFLLSIRSELRQVFKDALNDANIGIFHEYINLLYHLPKEDALKFNPKRDGITLRPITDDQDFEKINSMWSLRSENSLIYIKRLAKYILSFGAYKDDGTLVSWAFSFPDGLVGVLQTDEKHCGNGYGSLVVKALAKKMAEMGRDMYSAVNEENTPSQTLFSRLGAKSIGYVYCIVTENGFIASSKYRHT